MIYVLITCIASFTMLFIGFTARDAVEKKYKSFPQEDQMKQYIMIHIHTLIIMYGTMILFGFVAISFLLYEILNRLPVTK